MTRNPWADYWSGARAGGGCIPAGDAAVTGALDAVWRDFAGGLQANAKVLDLATGDGAVLRKLKAARPALTLVGVDSAPALPPAAAGIKLKPGVAMEALPFGKASFDAVTSQFGVEYGDTERIASQAAKVLRPEGRLCFVVHHGESAIVAHNGARRRALAWAAQDAMLLDKARRFVQARAIAPLPIPDAFAAAVSDARRCHPEQPVAAEFAAAILQTLDMGRARPPTETLARLALLETRASDEIGRLDALGLAACDAIEAERIARQLREAGIATAAPTVVSEKQGRPLAWLLRGAAG